MTASAIARSCERLDNSNHIKTTAAGNITPQQRDALALAISSRRMMIDRRRNPMGLTGDEKVLALSILRRLHLESGRCNPSIEIIAKDNGCSERSACRRLDRLRELGVLGWQRTGGSSEYWFPLTLLDEVASMESERPPGPVLPAWSQNSRSASTESEPAESVLPDRLANKQVESPPGFDQGKKDSDSVESISTNKRERGGGPRSANIESERPRRHPRDDGSLLPEDFALSDDLRSYAAAKNFSRSEIDQMFSKFKNHHQAKGSRRVNWNAAWRVWVDDETSYRAKNNKDYRPDGMRWHRV